MESSENFGANFGDCRRQTCLGQDGLILLIALPERAGIG
jgi:hypothetical protein